MSALGKLTASVALDVAEFVQGADKAKYTAAQMASEVDKTLKGLSSSVKSSITSIAAAIAGGFAINSLKQQFDSYAEGAAKLDDLAAKAGTTVEKMSGLVNVAKLSKTSSDELTAGLEKLARGMVNAGDGSTGAGKALAFLGISTRDSGGHLKDSATVTEEVAAKLALLQDGTGKTAIAMDLYGKSGANLLPMLKDLGEYGVQNATITARQAAIAKEYDQDLVRLGMAKSALVKIISSELLPVGDAVVKTFLNWQTAEGGARDQAQALAEDGSIRAFAMGVVNGFGLVLNAGDEVVRIFKLAGDEIGYLVARTSNALGAVGTAIIQFIEGDYSKAWNTLKDGSVRDTGIVVTHGQAMRDIFEKPLAGDAFVAGVAKNLSTIDEKGKQTGKTIKATADAYQGFGQVATAATDAELKSIIALMKAMDQLSQLGKDYQISLREQVDQQQFEVDMLGKTADQVQTLTAMRKLDLDLQKAVGKVQQDDGDALSMAQGEQIANMATLNDQAKTRIALLIQTGQAIKSQQADFQAQVSMWDAIGTAAGKFFAGFITTGKTAIQQFREDLKKLAADLIAFFAKRYLLQMVTGVAGSVGASGVQAAGNSALSSMGNSVMGTALTGANEWAGSLMGASTLTGGISSAVFGTGALTGAGDFVGTGLAGLAGNAALAAGATDAFAASIAAAIPVIGWIVAIGAILYAVFGTKGGAPKSGGSFMGAFDAGGSFTGSTMAPGDNNGRFFTPNGADSQMQTAVKGVAAGYYGTLARLGGTAPGSVGFGLGFDTDPGGTASNRVSSAVSVNGRTVFLSKDRDIGRDKDQIAPEMQLEASRMILSALQSSQLPQYIANVFKGVDAMTATQDTINNLLATADALKTIFDVTQHDPTQDLAQAMADSQNQLAAAMRNNKAAIEGAMKAWDGSLSTTQQLQSATVSYYNAQMQLLAGLEQTKQSIDSMFGNTIRNFQLAGLDDQGKYNYYQKDAASLQQQILSSSDPATIQALSQRLDQDMEAAFNLLSPEQQAGAEGRAFISNAETTDAAIQNHLDEIKKGVIDATNEVLGRIEKAIGASDEAQTAAANTQATAANTNLVAAQTPQVLIVQVDGRSQQVTNFRG